MKYIIHDWAGNHCFQTEVFNSFDDAWEYLFHQFAELEGEEFDDTLGEFEVVRQERKL